MKRFGQFILALAITAPLVTTVLASNAYYGAPNKKTLTTASKKMRDVYRGYVTLFNHTSQTYLVSATFYPSRTPTSNIILNPAGSIDPPSGQPSDILTYDISYPDSYVCISAMRYADGLVVLPTTCRGGGFRIDIGPAPINTLNAMPTVSIR